jgi:hypothetical protein
MKEATKMNRSNKPSAIPQSPFLPTPVVSLSGDNSKVSARLPTGDSVEVLLFGATVISWKSANGKENMFVSDKSALDGSRAVRGGIPVVFPVSSGKLLRYLNANEQGRSLTGKYSPSAHHNKAMRLESYHSMVSPVVSAGNI